MISCMAAEGEVRLKAHQAAPAAIRWIGTTRRAKVLHLFDRVCYLVNDKAATISLATPEVETGPFSAVVTCEGSPTVRETNWAAYLTGESPFKQCAGHLHLGPLIIDTAAIRPWWPRPDWEQLLPTQLQQNLPSLELYLEQLWGKGTPEGHAYCWPEAWKDAMEEGWQTLALGLANSHQGYMVDGARRLAGLGPGLTPAGDDVLVGTIHGIWATRPRSEASTWSEILTDSALAQTNTVSAAWLKAAGRGEATEAWHLLVLGLASSSMVSTVEAAERINATGDTSGPVALDAFVRAVRILIDARKEFSQK